MDLLKKLIRENGADAAAVIPSPNFFWLTGMRKHLMERPTVLLIAPEKATALIAAGFEGESFSDCGFNFQLFPFSDNPAMWGNAFKEAGAFLKLENARILVEPLHFRFHEFDFLRRNLPGCQLISGEKLFSGLRLRKTEDDLKKMRKAAEIAWNALQETLKVVKPGISERRVASELTLQLIRAGSDPELAFAPIVGSGPNAADPHAEPGERLLERGDFLLFDWGARYEGYCSDITRTFVIGEPSARQREVYQTVLAANQEVIRAAKAGVRCGDLDKTARGVIEDAGFGKYFTHRLGHGLGLETHEEPYMYAENDELLEIGMCFTDEPGIYLPGEFGIRIEDDLVITADGCEVLTDFPKELRSL